MLATADLREADLTASDFDWKAVLRSLPTAPTLFVLAFASYFPLARDVRDPHYIKVDRGERHVFEVTRTDGSAVHLHLKKRRNCDKSASFQRFLSRSALERLIVGRPD